MPKKKASKARKSSLPKKAKGSRSHKALKKKQAAPKKKELSPAELAEDYTFFNAERDDLVEGVFEDLDDD